MRHTLTLACALCALASPAPAGEADVVDVSVAQETGGTWRFAVTVRHADEGWDHYADRFEIVGPDGTVLGARVLAHPHVDEQPFTRTLPGVVIPEEIGSVTVRAHDGVHGLGGETIAVTLPR
ncbi:hypothetical protein ACTZWW_13505 [Salinarimonas sp. NSM]|uniref:hypothetical protein n=1 Tax=Salinarimonas sp. NSM TaxID=3458003 RepID=UPI0040354DFF